MGLKEKILDLKNRIEEHKKTIQSIENEMKDLKQKYKDYEQEVDSYYTDLSKAEEKAKKFFLPIGWIIAAAFAILVCIFTFTDYEWADHYREITNQELTFISLLQNFEEIKSIVQNTPAQSGFEITETWIWISAIMIVVALIMTVIRIVGKIKNKKLVSQLKNKGIDELERKMRELNTKLRPYYERIDTEYSAITSLTRYNGKEWDLASFKKADISQLEKDICDLFISIAYSPVYDNEQAIFDTWLFKPLKGSYEKSADVIKFINSKHPTLESEKIQHFKSSEAKLNSFMEQLQTDMDYWNDIPNIKGSWYAITACMIYTLAASKMAYIPYNEMVNVFKMDITVTENLPVFSSNCKSINDDQDEFIDILHKALPKIVRLNPDQCNLIELYSWFN